MPGVFFFADVREVGVGLFTSPMDRRLNAERVHTFGTLRAH